VIERLLNINQLGYNLNTNANNNYVNPGNNSKIGYNENYQPM